MGTMAQTRLQQRRRPSVVIRTLRADICLSTETLSGSPRWWLITLVTRSKYTKLKRLRPQRRRPPPIVPHDHSRQPPQLEWKCRRSPAPITWKIITRIWYTWKACPMNRCAVALLYRLGTYSLLLTAQQGWPKSWYELRVYQYNKFMIIIYVSKLYDILPKWWGIIWKIFLFKIG